MQRRHTGQRHLKIGKERHKPSEYVQYPGRHRERSIYSSLTVSTAYSRLQSYTLDQSLRCRLLYSLKLYTPSPWIPVICTPKFPIVIVSSQLVPLLTTCELSELFLRHTCRKSLEPTKYLRYVLLVHEFPLRFPDQCLDFQQTIIIQMIP